VELGRSVSPGIGLFSTEHLGHAQTYRNSIIVSCKTIILVVHIMFCHRSSLGDCSCGDEPTGESYLLGYNPCALFNSTDNLKEQKELCILLVPCLAYFLTLRMEVTCSSETSVDFKRTLRCYTPKNRTLHKPQIPHGPTGFTVCTAQNLTLSVTHFSGRMPWYTPLMQHVFDFKAKLMM
jgi:hypothetical protein